MSIYSGFPARKMEQQYNNLIVKLINLLQQHVLQYMSLNKSHKTPPIQKIFQLPSKLKKYKLVLNKMKMFEQHKHLEPKFSQVCQPLFIQIQEFLNHDKMDSIRKRQKSFSLQSTIQKNNEKNINQSNNFISQKKKIMKTEFDFNKKLQNRVVTYESKSKNIINTTIRSIKSSPKRYSSQSESQKELQDQVNRSSLQSPMNDFLHKNSQFIPTVLSSQIKKIRLYKSSDNKDTRNKQQVLANENKEQIIISKSSFLNKISDRSSQYSKSNYSLQSIEEQRQKQQEDNQFNQSTLSKSIKSIQIQQIKIQNCNKYRTSQQPNIPSKLKQKIYSKKLIKTQKS